VSNNASIIVRYAIGTGFSYFLNLMSFPFSRLARHRLSNAYTALQYPFYGDNYIELSDLLNSDDLDVRVAPVKAKIHNISSFELFAICSIIKDKRCNKIFEIGTFDGRTTRAMSMNLLNDQGLIYTINIPPQSTSSDLKTNEVDIQLAIQSIILLFF